MKTKQKNRYDSLGFGLKASLTSIVGQGQYNLARGFGVSAQSNGNALGYGTGTGIVRRACPEGAAYISTGQTTQECRPGFEIKSKNRPCDNGRQREVFISDEMDNPVFPVYDLLNSLPGGRQASERSFCFCSSNPPRLLRAGRTDYVASPLPRALPWAMMSRPFRPENKLNGFMKVSGPGDSQKNKR